jgi:HNH endonuclease
MPSGGYNKGKGKCIAWLREHVNHIGLNCLKYPFAVNKQTGYGQFGLDGALLYAHQWMCQQRNGPAPSPEHEAAHTCGNGHMSCINPNHLEWKTHQQNAQDRLRHGNYSNRKGEPRFKLNAEQAAQILALKGSKTQIELAGLFGVSRCTISSIHCGRGWNGTRIDRVFTDEEVLAIRSRRPSTKLADLAQEYGVKLTVMWRLCNGKTYRHVEDQPSF